MRIDTAHTHTIVFKDVFRQRDEKGENKVTEVAHFTATGHSPLWASPARAGFRKELRYL